MKQLKNVSEFWKVSEKIYSIVKDIEDDSNLSVIYWYIP